MSTAEIPAERASRNPLFIEESETFLGIFRTYPYTSTADFAAICITDYPGGPRWYTISWHCERAKRFNGQVESALAYLLSVHLNSKFMA